MTRLIIATSIVVGILVGCAGTTPTASPSPAPTAAPTAAPTVAPTAAPTASGQVRLNVTDGPEALHVLIDVPSTWQRSDTEQDSSHSVVRDGTTPSELMFINFGTFANTYADPCGHVLRDPAVGPTVEDLIAALAETPNLTATEPVQTTLGGQPAMYIELTVDDPLPCPAGSFYLTQTEDGYYYYIDGPGEIIRTWVLDVDGTRVVVWAFHSPEATAEALAEEQAIIDSVEFEAAN